MLSIQQRIELADARMRYAKDSDGKWITLESGTHVQVDKDGNITGGPAGLKEKGITSLKHFGEKSGKSESTPSTTVDNGKPPADTTPVVKSTGVGSEENMKATITIKGTTARAAEKLKSLGFVFQPSEKAWILNAERGKSKYDQEGFVDSNGNFIGNEESILHAVKTHAKAHDLTISVGELTADAPASQAKPSSIASQPSESEHISLRKVEIPYAMTNVREAAKALGARWDPQSKEWVCKTSADATKIRQMISPQIGNGELRLSSRRGTRDEHYKVGGTIKAPDGSIRIITSVDRPRFDDERSDYIHGVVTRPATEAEAAAATKAAEIRRLQAFLDTRRHGPDDDRDREAYEQATAEARRKLAELEAAK